MPETDAIVEILEKYKSERLSSFRPRRRHGSGHGVGTICRVGSAAIYLVTGVVQMMRRCRKHLLLHLIPSPSGVFVAGLGRGGAPRRKTPEAGGDLMPR